MSILVQSYFFFVYFLSRSVRMLRVTTVLDARWAFLGLKCWKFPNCFSFEEVSAPFGIRRCL